MKKVIISGKRKAELVDVPDPMPVKDWALVKTRAVPAQVSPDLLRKGLNLHGSWMYNRSLVPELFQVIQRAPQAKALISHRFPMSRVQEALALSATHDCAKIVLDPWT